MKKYKKYPKSKCVQYYNLHKYAYGKIWGTLDGQWIEVKNLRYSHLLNIEKHLKKTK